jgi:hypothetical protein
MMNEITDISAYIYELNLTAINGAYTLLVDLIKYLY